MQDIIQRLNEAKKRNGYTLKELSQRSGLTLGTVNKIMCGQLQKIKKDKLEALAIALDVTIEYLQGKQPLVPNAVDEGYLGLVKIACISPEVKVADCEFNAEQIMICSRKASQHGVKIAVFPELSITGYTCGDLFFTKTLRQGALDALNKITSRLRDLDTVIIVGLPINTDSGKLYNASAVIYRGEILGIVPKTNLPNYNEFIEKRLFVPFDGKTRFVNINGKQVPFGSDIIFANKSCPDVRFSIEICEDVWVADSPSERHAKAGANAIFNLSASNETVVKGEYRKKMIEIQSGMCGAIYAYCSSGMSESTAQTVFSGHNIICENGETVAESKPFCECYAEAEVDFDFISNERARLDRSTDDSDYLTVYYDMPITGTERKYSPTPFVPQEESKLNEVVNNAFNILSYGLKKRVEHVNASKLVIGVSGGSDSALSLLVCAKALKLMNRPATDIIAITMPCFGTSERTLNNSLRLIEAIGATAQKIDITAAVKQHLKDIGHKISDHDVVYENAQARERTQVLMDAANGCNGLVIGTGDMSEAALGWCTYNGDHMSMYAVNSSVPKTLVKAMLKVYAQTSKGELKKVLLDILDTPVSPELLPPSDNGITQITEDVIGPYELHDYFLFMLVRKGFSPSKVYKLAAISFAGKYDGKTVYKWLDKFIRRFFSQAFKRTCSPDGVRLGSVDISKLGMLMPSDASANTWLDDLKKVEPQD